MFYTDRLNKALRFGDVVKGYILTNPFYNEPNIFLKEGSHNYKIDVEIPEYSVVLTPCCNIEGSIISLTPLTHVRSDFLLNPYFAEDLTRINRMMTAQQAMTPEKWEELDDEAKQKRKEERLNYALLRYFIYAENDRFQEYKVRNRMICCHMIDLKNIYTIKCPKIKRANNSRPADSSILDSKILQLSVTSRKELRDKVAYYFSRPPLEDVLEED